MLDVPDFRTDDRERVVRDIIEMTRRRFKLARHLRDTRPWDFFMLVEMGPDRLHHAFWRFYDPQPSRLRAGQRRYEQAFRDYYRYLDCRGRRRSSRASATTRRSSWSPTTAPRPCTAASRSTSG